MAVKLGSDDSGDLVETADINITPFIDVILVLLIIFMVAAPLSTVDVPVELPVSSAPQQPRPDKPVFVSVKADLAIALGEEVVARPGLGAALDAATKGNKDERIFLRADKGVPYGELMGVMNLLRAAGYLKVGLVGLEDTSGGAQP
ncbi:TonB system transport protein ExbD [Methylorubrum thiocyanatum]